MYREERKSKSKKEISTVKAARNITECGNISEKESEKSRLFAKKVGRGVKKKTVAEKSNAVKMAQVSFLSI